jgi:hypothetical protein
MIFDVLIYKYKQVPCCQCPSDHVEAGGHDFFLKVNLVHTHFLRQESHDENLYLEFPSHYFQYLTCQSSLIREIHITMSVRYSLSSRCWIVLKCIVQSGWTLY